MHRGSLNREIPIKDQIHIPSISAALCLDRTIYDRNKTVYIEGEIQEGLQKWTGIGQRKGGGLTGTDGGTLGPSQDHGGGQGRGQRSPLFQVRKPPSEHVVGLRGTSPPLIFPPLNIKLLYL